MIPAGLKPWLAFGSGVGIQIDGPRGEEWMHIAAVRVRPSGAKIAEQSMVPDFPHQPAAAWGADYAAFLKKNGMQQAIATVILPRQDVIVRQLTLPGVTDKDLAAAIQFQLDGLHPYHEDDVVTGWTRLPGTSTVLVSIVRRDVVERYTTLFAEAGVKVGCFTCSAAVIYSALRLWGKRPPAELLAWEPVAAGGIEVYGESPAKPMLSATFPIEAERALVMAAAELRLEHAPEPLALEGLLGATPALPMAAALTAACPRLALPLNLLPASLRQTSSPMAWIPAAALGVLVLLLAGALSAYPYFEDRRYLKSLEAEIAKVQPGATRSAALDKRITDAQRRTALLDDFRNRTKRDMDVIAEMTRLLPPPAWLNLLEFNGRQVTIAGEADQAAPLLKTIDASPLFISSEFAMPPMRVAGNDATRPGEAFRIRTNREGARP